MKNFIIEKEDHIKSWETLKKEVEDSKLTCYLCNQGFDETKNDSYQDHGWGDENDDGTIVGNSENQDYETVWKQDVMCRMLEENLDYGKYNETEDEQNDDRLHSNKMDIRSSIVDRVAYAWIFADNGFKPDQENYQGNTVYNIETAQELTNKLIEKI